MGRRPPSHDKKLKIAELQCDLVFFERIECHTRGIALFTLSGPPEELSTSVGPEFPGDPELLGPLRIPKAFRAPTEAQTLRYPEDAQYKQSLLPYSKHTEKEQ